MESATLGMFRTQLYKALTTWAGLEDNFAWNDALTRKPQNSSLFLLPYNLSYTTEW